MPKLYNLLLIVLTAGINLSASVKELDIYENMHQTPVAAGGIVFNNSALEFLPFGLNELGSLKKYTIATSFDFSKGGVEFGKISSDGEVRPQRTTLENIDFVKSALLVYALRPDFLPFVSYHTPFKYHADNDLGNEIVKRQDVVSAGFLSSVGANSIGFSFDYNLSDYQIIESNKTYHKKAWGLSNRVAINLQTAKNSFWSAGVISPVYAIQKEDNTPDELIYLNKLVINTAFNFDNKQYTASYGATYREFNTFLDNQGNHLNHPWVVEHKICGGYYINKGVRFVMDYQFQPSIYIRPAELKGNRHSIGAGLFYRYNSSYWNFYGSDSRLLSDEKMARTFFKLDVGFTF